MQTRLVLGDGDGRFTAALLSRYPQLEVHAVDLSPAMLALLKARSPAAPHLHSRRPHPAPAGRYDLVVTHFFLDCLTLAEVESLVRRVLPLLAPGTLWLVSEFRIPPGLLRRPARVYVRGLYLLFRVLTGLRTTQLPDHRVPTKPGRLRCQVDPP